MKSSKITKIILLFLIQFYVISAFAQRDSSQQNRVNNADLIISSGNDKQLSKTDVKKSKPSPYKDRTITKELLNKYVAVSPGYIKNVSKIEDKANSYLDKNSIDLIITLHDKFKIEDEQLESYLESKMTPEQKKLAILKKEEESKRKANEPQPLQSETPTLISE